MEFWDLIDIAAREMELENPISQEKIVTLGSFLRLREGSRVIDFGCGFAEPLLLWAEHYGISAVGIDVRPYACDRARKKVEDRGLADRIEIVCADASTYAFEPGRFDAATCIGATFIWGGYAETVRALKPAVRGRGRLGIGEQIWLQDTVPPAYASQEAGFTRRELDILRLSRREGFDVERVVRASPEDWDRYETDRWHGLIRWLEENPSHPDRPQVVQRLHAMQEEYLGYGRQYMGWATYVLAPGAI